MKQFKFFAMALAALAIVSCSKGDVNGDKNEHGDIGGPTYATFLIKSGVAPKSVSAKSVIDPAAPVGQAAAEKLVRKVRLLIFSEDGGKLLETNKLVEIAAGATETAFVEVVKAGAKKMFMIANETVAMEAKLKDDVLVPGTAKYGDFIDLTHSGGVDAEFTLADLYTISTEAGALSHGLPMSSSDKKSYVFKAGITEADMKDTEKTGDAYNKFTLDLSFMLAKVKVVAKENILKNHETITFHSIKYAIANVSRETYLTQQFDNDRVRSVYYNFIPEFPAEIANWKQNYFSGFARNLIIADQTADIAAAQSLYVTENTKSKATALQGGTTYASIECEVMAKGQYTGVSMGWDRVENVIKLGTVETLAAPATFLVTNRAIGTIAPGTPFRDTVALNQAAVIIEQGAAWKDKTEPEARLIAGKDYIVYTGGKVYYRVDIAEGTTAKVFGVERGKDYTITINSIGGFGSATADPSPDKPVDQNTYIQANINVKNWETATSSIEL